MKIKTLLPMILLASAAATAKADVVMNSVVIPVKAQMTYNLNALFLKDTSYSQPPLIVLSSGSPTSPAERKSMTPDKMLGRAQAFVQLGFDVLIVERRGYGTSEAPFVEKVGECDDMDHVVGGNKGAFDINAAVSYAQANLPIDPTKVILVGHSAGGLFSLVAAAANKPGVLAAISFSGGRGANGHGQVCNAEGPNGLVDALKIAGQKSRAKTLWVYSANDQSFPQGTAQSMFAAYGGQSGRDEFVMLGNYGKDGHQMFSEQSNAWKVPAVSFLKELGVCPNCN